MDRQQIKLLNEMKLLIKVGKRKFINRKDRNYLEDLLEIGISVEKAWECLLSLNEHYYFYDPKPNYDKSNDTLTFKRIINNEMVYIKLKMRIT